MSAAEKYAAEGADQDAEETTGNVLGTAPEVVEIRRNGGLAALVGVLASAVAIAWLARAVQTGNVIDWVLFAVTGILGVAWLRTFVDARTPLLVADSMGVRLRLGRAWRGLPWGALAVVEHTPRRGLFKDGRIALHPHNTERVLAQLDSSGRRQSAWSERLTGSPLAVPLGLSTKVSDLSEDLTTSLRILATASGTQVVEVRDRDEDDPAGGDVAADRETETDGQPDRAHQPAHHSVADSSIADQAEIDAVLLEEDRGPSLIQRMGTGLLRGRRVLAAGIARVGNGPASGAPATQEAEDAPSAARERTPQPIVASATPSPLRQAASVARIEIRSNLVVEGSAARKLDDAEDDESSRGDLPEGRELRRDGSVSLVEDNLVWGDRVSPIATAGDAVEPLVIDDFAVVPAAEPVIGPEISAARTRLGLSVDALAERTRIRPHVIESIEVDDFHACGGDFYARGHLRTLARVLGLDAAPLLKDYDDKYADAPIDPRRVFEAELATGAGGGIRATKGGPNWSLLIAVVMTLVLAWSIARLVMDNPVEIQNPAPVLNGSDGPNRTAPTEQNVTLKVSATGSTHLEVRDGEGNLVFDDDVTYGEVHRIDVVPPVQVSAGDAGSIDVEIDGDDRGALGADGKEASKTFRAE